MHPFPAAYHIGLCPFGAPRKVQLQQRLTCGDAVIADTVVAMRIEITVMNFMLAHEEHPMRPQQRLILFVPM